MLEKLLELLLSAKSGVIAGVFLIGTTGALVTATVQNGVTTITVAEASPSASASASPTASATTSPTASPTASPSSSPSASPLVAASASPSACTDVAADVREVNTAFSKFHTDLMHRRESARGDANRAAIETADKTLKQIRDNAVKAIHAASTCAKTDDEDKNEDQDKDTEGGDKSHAQGNFLIVLLGNLFGNNTTNTVTTASPTPTASASPTATASASPSSGTTTLTGSDPKALADQAVAAMQVVFDNAIAQLPVPTASLSPKAGHSDARDSHGTGRGSGDHD